MYNLWINWINIYFKIFVIVPGEVSNVTVTDITSTNFTIRWGRPAVLNGDLRNYSVIISNETYNKTEEVLTTNMFFTNLNPGDLFVFSDKIYYVMPEIPLLWRVLLSCSKGLCFHITIAAVNDAGKGKEKKITVYTNEQSMQNPLIKNMSNQYIKINNQYQLSACLYLLLSI